MDSDLKDEKQLALAHPPKKTQKAVSAYVKRRMLAGTPEITDNLIAAINKALKQGDAKTIRTVAEMLGVVKQGGGLTINNNNVLAQQSNGMKSERGFESIVRRLEARDQERRISDVQEGEFEDLPAA